MNVERIQIKLGEPTYERLKRFRLQDESFNDALERLMDSVPLRRFQGKKR